MFALHAGWPIPDVNESHYLVKAKHFWNPDWIPRDFFLEPPSGAPWWAEGHILFYALTGWLTLWAPLYSYAVIGRVLTWLIMAIAWRQLSIALVPRSWLAPLTAALFVCFNEHFQMAGEWVVGGFEAKGLSYALMVFALAAMVRGRWRLACFLTGIATALHVLVGGWAGVALMGVWLSDAESRPSAREFLFGLLLIALPALLGIVPALALDRGATPEMIEQSRMIYVLHRLPHHLIPGLFPLDATTRFALLFCVWVLTAWQIDSPTLRRLRSFVLLAVTICAAGIALSFALWHVPNWEARLMRYYWFRLADFALPVGAAFSLVAVVLDASSARAPVESRRRSAGLAVLVLIAAIYVGWHGFKVVTTRAPRSDASSKVVDAAAWREAAEWARENTPSDVRFLTPRTAQTFKWHAERSEVVSWKDLPQDARGILEWWSRLNEIHVPDEYSTNRWLYKSLSEQPAERLAALGRKYEAQYVITEALPELPFERVFTNGVYSIYRLPGDD